MAEKTYLSTEHFRIFTLLRRRLRPALVVYIGGCRSARKLLQVQRRQAKGSLRATCNCTVTTRSCGSSAAGRAVDAPRSGRNKRAWHCAAPCARRAPRHALVLRVRPRPCAAAGSGKGALK